jgi:VWFA-related protein
MRRERVSGLVGVTLAFVASVSGQPSPPRFPSKVEVVTIDVVVLDAKGRPVPDLTRDDFVVQEDGRPQEIVSFEAFASEVAQAAAGPSVSAPVATNETGLPPSGRAFAVVVDDVGLTIREALDARHTVTRLVERSVGAGDEVTLATTSGSVWWSAHLPEGREDLLAVAGRLKGSAAADAMPLAAISDYEAYAIASGGIIGGRILERVKTRWINANMCFPRDPGCDGRIAGAAGAIDGRRRIRTRTMLATVRRTLGALAVVRGRKSLLLISRGFLNEPGTDARDVVAAAREANTAIYFLDVRGLVASPGLPSAADAGGPPDPGEVGAMMFESSTLDSAGASTLAGDTGGLAVRNTNDLAGAAERIAAESRVFYMLGFVPPAGKPPGDWRKVRVEVKREGLTVRARRGYRLRAAAADAPGKPADAKENTRKLPAAVESALDSVHESAGIPLRAIVYVLEPRPKETTRVLIASEFDSSGLSFEGSGKARVARLEVTAAATLRDTGRTLYSDQRVEVRVPEGESPGWRSFAREFDLPAGVAQARIVVRDPTTGTLGAVSHRFEVPPPGVLRLSTPIVSDQVAPPASGRGRSSAAVGAHRVFRPQGALYCEFEVFGAAREGASGRPRVSAGIELRTAEGTPLRQASATPIAADADGRVVRLAGIGLDGLPEGAYELVLDVRDDVGGGRLERRDPFTLARGDLRP